MNSAPPPPADATPALEISGLNKSYRVGHLRPRRHPALQDLSLVVPAGEVFGYLGPNGSGKTTTLKVLMGLVRLDSGTARILGHALAHPAWKQRAGYLPEQAAYHDYLTAREYLDYAGRLFGMAGPLRRERTEQLLARVGLTRQADVALRRFSKGMTQRLGLAQALLNDPDIVFLDEPMSGLDPIGRRMVREIILDLKARGRTVFFSTHILSDAESLCDQVGVLRGGRLLQSGRLSEILNLDVAHLEVLVSGGALAGADDAPPGIRTWRALGERFRLEVDEGALLPVLHWLQGRGGRVLAVQPVRQSLEDYFFQELGAGASPERWD